ncbi:MAG TPA: S9 family peptidase [Pyrinomonadaceae bacterium]|jgi:dipeptidyl aminopeptidase/acylaminoacyl peptidase
MKRLVISVAIVLLALVSTQAQQAAGPLNIEELLKVRRVGDPQISPDGRNIAYQVGYVDKAANRTLTHIFLIPVEGGSPRQLTTGERSSTSPRWSPDGKRIAFISAREGSPQIWTIDLATNELKKITNIPTGADGPVWSADGNWLAFTSDIYPECADEECNRRREQQAEESKVKAKTTTRLLFRHWNAFKEGKRTHVFVVSANGGAARDLTPGDYDAPPFSLGGPTDYAFSPDARELAFVRNTDRVEALSTNSDIFVVSTSGGEPRRLTGSNQGADASPLYSPDGRYIAYRSQLKAGFESDRWRLMLYDRQANQSRSLTDQLNASAEGFEFSPDSQRIYFAVAERGHQYIYSIPVAGGAATKLIGEGFNDDVHLSKDGKTLVFSRSTGNRPTEIFRASADGSGATQVTRTNDSFIDPFNLRPLEEITWTGGGGTKVSGFITRPPDFTPNRKWPMIVLIHGGPQGAWNDAWSYRWNPQVFAAAGYVVFMPNPRGSTGYGQQFVDEISGDWGGKVVTDIMNGVAQVISLGYVDKNNLGAAGGSYGGYMVNWIEGHNNDKRFQFKALVSHAGVYNLTSMYGATEELWFPEWEFKGAPWTNPEMYTKWSPHMFVKNFRTPMLVTHGELDYRVPIGEGLQLFTALQRMGVDSKLLYFPDEGHWILKPQNSELWYKTVIGWFDAHLKTGGLTQPTAARRN